MEWIKCIDKLPKTSCVVFAKTLDSDVMKCYYHADSANWLRFYGVEPSRWQDHKTQSFINDENVTHWSCISLEDL